MDGAESSSESEMEVDEESEDEMKTKVFFFFSGPINIILWENLSVLTLKAHFADSTEAGETSDP